MQAKPQSPVMPYRDDPVDAWTSATQDPPRLYDPYRDEPAVAPRAVPAAAGPAAIPPLAVPAVTLTSPTPLPTPPSYASSTSPPKYAPLPSSSEQGLLLAPPPPFDIATPCPACADIEGGRCRCASRPDWAVRVLVVLNTVVWGAVLYSYCFESTPSFDYSLPPNTLAHDMCGYAFGDC